MLVDKPCGWTSHDVVAVVRKRLGVRGVGHAGTLDPFATGLLVVLVGRATRLAQFVAGLRKRYRATVRFGTATDTDDSTGRVTQSHAVGRWPARAEIDRAVASFVGGYRQRPPAYSAKHVAGKRSHALARQGRAVDLAPVPVAVDDIAVLEWTPPDLTIEATVGKGTYLRALARDVGERVGMPAHCAALRREAIGPWTVAAARHPGEVTAADLLPPAAMLPDLSREVIGDAERRDVAFGRTISQREHSDATGALLASDGHLVAVARGRAGQWHPLVVLEAAP